MDFFRRNSVVRSNAQDATLGTLQASLTDLQGEERKLRERCQKLELEKSLLQNFVDSVYSNLEDATAPQTGADHLLKNYCDSLRSSNVDLQARLEDAAVELSEAKHLADMQQRRATGLEAALTQVQSDLRTADGNAQSALIAEVEPMKKKYELLLEERNSTIKELMERSHITEAQYKRTILDLECIVQRTVAAQDQTSNELADRLHALHEANRKIGLLASERPVETFEMFQLSTTFMQHFCDVSEAALHYASECVSITSVASFDLVSSGISALQDGCRRHEQLLNENAQLVERLAVKEARILEARLFLSQAEERCSAAECEVMALRNELVTSTAASETLQNDAEVLRDRVRKLEKECETQLIEIDALRQEQLQSHGKVRQAQQLVKDLQQQLLLNETRGTGAPVTNEQTQHLGEMEELLGRLTQLQERVWLLETAKSSYESELDRLSTALEERSTAIRMHFSAAAQQSARAKGKSGILGVSKKDVMDEVHIMLEESLLSNLQLDAKVLAQNSRLEMLEEALKRAQEAGFEMEELEEQRCDAFD